MTVESNSRPAEKVCNVDECNAWKTGDYPYCHHHKGLAETTGAPENNANGKTHGMHQSIETFYENADEHFLDQFTAVFEAFCTRYERIHGREPDHGAKQNLKIVSFKLIKQDLAIEYMIENAVDPEMPLTERAIEDVGGDPVEVEKLSKVVPLMNQFDREARLKLKDMGLMRDPETKKADAMSDISELWPEDVRD